MIPIGQPLLARGGTWSAPADGLLDMRVGPGSFVHEGDTVASISDPSNPSLAMEIYAPHDGIFIGTATNPFVTAGTPFGHFLRLKRHSELVASHLDERSRLRVQGSDEGSIWRSEHEVTDIELDGEWSGGSVDAEWTQGVLESTGDEQTGLRGCMSDCPKDRSSSRSTSKRVAMLGSRSPMR